MCVFCTKNDGPDSVSRVQKNPHQFTSLKQTRGQKKTLDLTDFYSEEGGLRGLFSTLLAEMNVIPAGLLYLK